MAHSYSYESALHTAERVAFRLDQVLAPDARFDFSRPFMPEALAGSQAVPGLTPEERLTLNQVRGFSYLCLFGLVEEFILPFVVDHARPELGTDDARTRALLGFAGEEAKHIQLFKRFRDCFERDFGSPCEVIGPAPAIARAVLGHGPLAVALLILHIEWMTQRHFVESVRDEEGIEPQFKRLLHQHWLEEAQHAKLDTLIVESIAAKLGPREIRSGVDEYLELVNELSGLLDAQLAFDIQSFERARRFSLVPARRAEITRLQRRAVRWTFLGTGMTHPNFLATLEAILPDSSARVRAVAETLCETSN